MRDAAYVHRRKQVKGRIRLAIPLFVILEVLILLCYFFLDQGPKLLILAFSMPAIVCLLVISVLWPWTVLGASLVTIGLLFPISFGLSGKTFLICWSDIFLAVVSAGLFVGRAIEKKMDLRLGPLELSLALFVLAGVMSLGVSGDILHSLGGILRWVIIFVFFVVTTETATRLKEPLTLLYLVPIFGTIVSLEFIVEFLTMRLSLVEIAGGRGALGLSWARSNYLAAILALSLLVTITLLLYRKGRMRFTLFLSVIVMLVALVLTTSRGGLVTFAIGLAFLMLRAGRRGVSFLVVMLPFAFAIGQSFVFKYTLLRFAGVTKTFSVKARFSAWREALENFQLHPIFGVGSGPARDPHNLPLEVASKMGIIGLVAGAVLVGAILVTLGRAKRALATKDILYHGFSAVVLAAGINCLFEPVFFSGWHYSTLFWFVMAVVSVLRPEQVHG
ncbi:MAG: O-antigen ligase family protein [Candidatus Eisenbacteria bacterium]|nr:O-antigen ligase family protein [Candidatus Eisenbacteria bacterium]